MNYADENYITYLFMEKLVKLILTIFPAANDFTVLSGNPIISMDYVEKHPEYEWNWEEISANPAVTLDYIEQHPTFPWCWSSFSSNSNITMDHVEKHPSKPWCWIGLSKNPNISLDYMREHPEKPWDSFQYKLKNMLLIFDFPYKPQENQTMDMIEQNILEMERQADIHNEMTYANHVGPLDDEDEYSGEYEIFIWDNILNNSNITLEFIEKYNKKCWCYYGLQDANYTKAKQDFRKKHLAALKIQQAYIRARYIPKYALCRKLHMDFYNSHLA